MTSDSDDEMPQPLSSFVQRLSTEFRTEYTPAGVARYPDAAIQLGLVVTAWARCELSLGVILASLLGAEPKTGIAMYSALSSTTAQQAVLEAAAESVLKGQDKALYDTLMAMVESVQKQRNDIVHGIWGSSTDLPNRLICSPAKLGLKLSADLVGSHRAIDHLTEDDQIQRGVAFVRQTMVYTVKNIRNVARDIETVTGHLLRFAESSQDAQERQRLFDEPDVQRWLHRADANPKKNP